MRASLAFLLLGFFSVSAFAEYRAFLLKISNKQNPQDFRLVPSNLDPEQYPAYYPVRPEEQIQYIQTWMCRGRTNDETAVCPNPKAPAEPATTPTETQTPAKG